MDIEVIGKDILDCAYAIHSRFGSGLLEKAYRVILVTELRRLGHKVEEEKVCGFSYNGQEYQNMFRVDLLVDDCIVVELKSVSRREPVFAKQCLTYLRLLDKRLGYVINCGLPYIKDGIESVVNKIQRNFADVADIAVVILGYESFMSQAKFAFFREVISGG